MDNKNAQFGQMKVDPNQYSEQQAPHKTQTQIYIDNTKIRDTNAVYTSPQVYMSKKQYDNLMTLIKEDEDFKRMKKTKLGKLIYE